MLLLCGALPHRNLSVPLWRVPVVACLTALLLSWPVAAQPNSPLTLAGAEALALEREPGEAVYRARAESLAEQAVAAGQLPDPTLRMGLANFPIESGGFSTEGMTQGQLGIRQSFPPGKTLSLRTRQFRSLSQEMDRTADARTRDVLTSVRIAWLDAYYWERAHTILGESRSNYEDLVTVTRSLYSVGKKNQQDVLAAELELSRIDDRLIDVAQQRAQAHAMLTQWVGEGAVRTIDSQLPGWDRLPELQVLQDDLVNHPALRAADAKIAAQDTGVSLAEQRYKPGWAVDVGYGYRDGLLPNGSPRSDFLSLSFSVDLPVFRKNRQDRGVAAALGERRAATESKEQLLRRLSSQLQAEFARWQELSRRIELYQQRILVQVEDQATAALAAYRSDAGDFADVMRSAIDELNARLDYVRLQTQRAQSYAVLANLGGLPR